MQKESEGDNLQKYGDTPEVVMRFSKKRAYHPVRPIGRQCVVYNDGEYEIYALEQIGQTEPFSARLIVPEDDITPYRWIKAWVTCETWSEALIAADMLAERIRQGLPLGEHELVRRAAQ